MSAIQTDIKAGKFPINAGIALTDLEGRLVKLVDGGSIAEVLLPEAVSDLALYIVDKGGAIDTDVDVIPLTPNTQQRVRLNGTVSAGAVLVLCDPSGGTNAGKVETVPATQGLYFSPGIAEEDGVDEQLVKFRPLPRLVYVGTAFSSATPAATAATNSSPYGFSQAQADAILTNVREMRAFMVAAGWKATA